MWADGKAKVGSVPAVLKNAIQWYVGHGKI
jgi:hypothetical protein